MQSTEKNNSICLNNIRPQREIVKLLLYIQAYPCHFVNVNDLGLCTCKNGKTLNSSFRG